MASIYINMCIWAAPYSERMKCREVEVIEFHTGVIGWFQGSLGG